MKNFIKYEIKGTYKYILGVLALVLVLFTGIFIYFFNARVSGEGSILGGMFVALSMMVLFGTALAAFLFIVGSFKKELYEDQGYLTFTLPLSGGKIVGAKLLVALLWFIVLSVGVSMYLFVLTMIFTPVELDFSELVSEYLKYFKLTDLLVAAFGIIYFWGYMLLLIYFSMTLSRITLRNKKIGGLWFIIFLLLGTILSSFEAAIGTLVPLEFALYSFDVGHSANIGSTIFSLLIPIALFWGTAYLLEKKIDL